MQIVLIQATIKHWVISFPFLQPEEQDLGQRVQVQ